MIIQVRRGETDQIPGDRGKRPVCYKAGNHGICYVHSSGKSNL